MTTMVDVSTLTVVQCSHCAIRYAIPEDMRERLLRSHGTFYCPSGHSQFYPQESDLEREKRQRIQAQASLARRTDELEHERRSRAAFKGQVTKLRNKLARGECPCCSKVFGNVREHIRFKHPEFSLTDVETSLGDTE